MEILLELGVLEVLLDLQDHLELEAMVELELLVVELVEVLVDVVVVDVCQHLGTVFIRSNPSAQIRDGPDWENFQDL